MKYLAYIENYFARSSAISIEVWTGTMHVHFKRFSKMYTVCEKENSEAGSECEEKLKFVRLTSYFIELKKI